MLFRSLNTTDSGTYSQLHSVSIVLTGLNTLSKVIPTLLAECLQSAELACVREGKSPYLSLVDFKIKAEEEASAVDRTQTQLQTQTRSELSVTEKAPAKFMKYMRRESILHGRMRESNGGSVSPNMEGTAPMESEIVEFQGLQIKVPNSAE